MRMIQIAIVAESEYPRYLSDARKTFFKVLPADESIGQIEKMTEDQVIQSGGLRYLEERALFAVREFWKRMQGGQ